MCNFGRFPPDAVQYDRSWLSAGGLAAHDPIRTLPHPLASLHKGLLKSTLPGVLSGLLPQLRQSLRVSLE
jgi:hypothetical protein